MQYRHSLLAALASAALASAQGDCVDQSYVPASYNNGLEVTASQPVTQTFTCARTGQLTRLEISAINHHRGAPTQPLLIDIVVVDPQGVPTNVSLASLSIPPVLMTAAPGPLGVDLRAFGIQVASGQMLGIALSTTAASGGATYAWSGNAPGGTYAGGQVFINQTTALSVWDLAFRTWIASPASWTTYGSGHPGTSGAPSISSSADPLIGTTPQILVSNSLGAQTFGIVAAGFGRVNLPSPVGGTLLVQPAATFLIGMAAAGGNLALSLPADPRLCGTVLDVQAAVFDGGASQGVALSNGLEYVIGG